jgi:alkaline phosphatase
MQIHMTASLGPPTIAHLETDYTKYNGEDMKLPDRFKQAAAITLLGSLLTSTTWAEQQAVSASEITSSKRNVILIIGDGMDDTQVTMGRNYLKGAQGRLLLDNMPHRGTVQVLTVAEDTPENPVYVADSANSATSIATGVSTSRGRIGTTAKEDKDITTIAELAKAAGFATGIVSTANVTDATPASFVAHVSSRGCENPSMMVNAEAFAGIIVDCSADTKALGGKGSIAEQIADADIDVVLGGGQKHFAINAENKNQPLSDIAQANNYQLITTPKQLQDADISKKLLGLFAKSTLPVRLQGENGRSAEDPEASFLNKIDWRLGSVELPEPMKCEANPEFEGIPHLRDMTETALNHLAARGDQGFFLMVESASIDKQSHARKSCGQIGELEQLEESLQVALKFAERNPNTLILVTADHGQASQIIPDGSLFSAMPVPVYSPGKMTRIITPEGQIMAVNYATTHDFPMEEHTGTTVPLYSNLPIPAMTTQPELFGLMSNHLQLD